MNNRLSQQEAGKAQYPESASFRSQLAPILFLTAIFFLGFLGRIVPSPLMPTVEKDLGLSHGGAGSLFLMISLGYCIALLGSTFISASITHRRTIVFSSTLAGIALLGISFADNVWEVRLGLFVAGLAGGVYFPSGMATITSLVRPNHWGKAIAVHELAPNIGLVAAPVVCEVLLLSFSWRSAFALVGMSCVLVGAAFARFGKGGNFCGESLHLDSLRMLVSNRSFWIMAGLFAMGTSGLMGVYTMLPLFLVVERGIDRNWANVLISLSRVLGIGMVFLSGWASDRLGPRRIMTGIFLLTGIMTLLIGVVKGPWIVPIIFLQAMLVVCFAPVSLVALYSVNSPGTRNMAVSFTVPLAFLIGGGVIPTGIGIMGDNASFGLGFALLGLIIIMGSLLPRALKLPR